MASRQMPLIIISKRTTPERLSRQVAKMSVPFAIQGQGVRARRLIEGLAHDRPSLPMRWWDFGNEWVALVEDSEEPSPFHYFPPGE